MYTCVSLFTHEVVSTHRAFSNKDLECRRISRLGQCWLIAMIVSPDSVLRLALRFSYLLGWVWSIWRKKVFCLKAPLPQVMPDLTVGIHFVNPKVYKGICPRAFLIFLLPIGQAVKWGVPSLRLIKGRTEKGRGKFYFLKIYFIIVEFFFQIPNAVLRHSNNLVEN